MAAGSGYNNATLTSDPKLDEVANDEFAQLVKEIESDPEVRLVLDGAPEVPPLGSRTAQSARTPVSRETLPGARANRSEDAGNTAPVVVYRDKDDVRTIINQTWVMMLLVVMLVASATGNIFQYLRRPDRIVVDGGSGRVLSINDKNYGREQGVEIGPDRLTEQDKLYLTREWVEAMYKVDPATRNKDVERALTMMVPDSARKTARWLRDKGILDEQKEESWQTTWTPMEVSVDKNDPYTVNIIGKQDITKVVKGVTKNETKQLKISIKLVADSKGRADRNIRSGFLVAAFDTRELNTPAAPGSDASQATNNSAASDKSDATPVTALLDK
jgi:hypothetical protein